MTHEEERWLVLDHPFNRHWHKHLIGKVFSYPIPYCAVRKIETGETITKLNEIGERIVLDGSHHE